MPGRTTLLSCIVWLLPFLLVVQPSVAQAAISLTLAWDATTQNEDGTTAEIAGYWVHDLANFSVPLCDTKSPTTSCNVTLGAGKFKLVVIAYDKDGQQSQPSIALSLDTEPTPTPTPTSTATSTPTPTFTATFTATATPTMTATSTAMATATTTATPTATPRTSPTVSPSPTSTPDGTASATPTPGDDDGEDGEDPQEPTPTPGPVLEKICGNYAEAPSPDEEQSELLFALSSPSKAVYQFVGPNVADSSQHEMTMTRGAITAGNYADEHLSDVGRYERGIGKSSGAWYVDSSGVAVPFGAGQVFPLHGCSFGADNALATPALLARDGSSLQFLSQSTGLTSIAFSTLRPFLVTCGPLKAGALRDQVVLVSNESLAATGKVGEKLRYVVRALDPETKSTTTLFALKQVITHISVLSDGRIVVVALNARNVPVLRLWEPSTKRIVNLPALPKGVGVLSISPFDSAALDQPGFAIQLTTRVTELRFGPSFKGEAVAAPSKYDLIPCRGLVKVAKNALVLVKE